MSLTFIALVVLAVLLTVAMAGLWLYAMLEVSRSNEGTYVKVAWIVAMLAFPVTAAAWLLVGPRGPRARGHHAHLGTTQGPGALPRDSVDTPESPRFTAFWEDGRSERLDWEGGNVRDRATSPVSVHRPDDGARQGITDIKGNEPA